MAVVKFNNTLNVGYTVANTSGGLRSFEFPIPPGKKGDTIILIASGNTTTTGHTANIHGYQQFLSTTDAGPNFYGNIYVGTKISNGQETVARIRTLSSAANAEFCVIAMRVEGAHRISPCCAFISNTSIDGVAGITSGNPTQSVNGGDGYLQMTVCASQSNTAFSDSDIPSGTTLLAKANTNRTSLIVSYQNRPATNTGYGGIVWGRTLDNKRALTFSIIPDTEAIGHYGGTHFRAAGINITRNTNHYMNYGGTGRYLPLFLAKDDEEVGEVGCSTGSLTTFGDGSPLDIAIYDISDGLRSTSLVGTASVNVGPTAVYRNTFYPPIKLIKDKTYAVVWSTKSATNLNLSVSGYNGDTATRVSSLNGSFGFASTWTDNTTTSNPYTVFGMVRNKRKLYISSTGYFNNTVSGTSHTGDFREDPGTRRKIVVMGFAEDQTVAMANCRFDGVPMIPKLQFKPSDASEAFSVWYYDVPDSGGQLMDFGKDFVEFDPGADLSLTGNNQINIDTMNSSSTGQTGYRLDCGTAWKIGDFRARLGPINVSAKQSDTSGFVAILLSDRIENRLGSDEGRNIQVKWRSTSDTTGRIRLLQYDPTFSQSTTSPVREAYYDSSELYLNSPFYLELSRVGLTAICKIYKDSNYSNLITTLSINLTEVAPLRYCYIASRESTGATETASATIQNLRFMDVCDDGIKKISMETVASTNVCSWQAWQLNNAEPGEFEAFGNTYSTLGTTTIASNTVTISEGSMLLATAVSSSPARRWSWDYDVVIDRAQPNEENDFRIATADRIQYTGGSKTVTATSTGTEGNKYLAVASIKPYKSKKVKTGAF